jgi:hypothetical protein
MEPAAQDKACGLELRLIDVESELEWAEAQGRDGDAVELRAEMSMLMHQLADTVEDAFEPAVIHAPHAA